MNDPQKYFYFRVKDTFFDEPVIWNMKNIAEVGYEMIVCLLELYVISVKDGGVIKIPLEERLNGYLNTEYVHEEDKIYKAIQNLAKRLRLPLSKMEAFFKYYIQNDLLTVNLDEKVNQIEINAKYVQNNIGKSSKEADAKRLKYRQQDALPAAKLDRTEKKPMIEKIGNTEVQLSDEQLEELKNMIGGGNTKLRNIIYSYKEYKKYKEQIQGQEIEDDFEELKEYIRRN